MTGGDSSSITVQVVSHGNPVGPPILVEVGRTLTLASCQYGCCGADLTVDAIAGALTVMADHIAISNYGRTAIRVINEERPGDRLTVPPRSINYRICFEFALLTYYNDHGLRVIGHERRLASVEPCPSFQPPLLEYDPTTIEYAVLYALVEPRRRGDFTSNLPTVAAIADQVGTDRAKITRIIRRLSDSLDADSDGSTGWRKNMLAEHVITNDLIDGPPLTRHHHKRHRETNVQADARSPRS